MDRPKVVSLSEPVSCTGFNVDPELAKLLDTQLAGFIGAGLSELDLVRDSNTGDFVWKDLRAVRTDEQPRLRNPALDEQILALIAGSDTAPDASLSVAQARIAELANRCSGDDDSSQAVGLVVPTIMPGVTLEATLVRGDNTLALRPPVPSPSGYWLLTEIEIVAPDFTL